MKVTGIEDEKILRETLASNQVEEYLVSQEALYRTLKSSEQTCRN